MTTVWVLYIILTSYYIQPLTFHNKADCEASGVTISQGVVTALGGATVGYICISKDVSK